MTQEDDQSTVIKTIFKDITSLQNVIQETQSIEELFDQNETTIDKCIESTKTIVTSLKESVDKIYEIFNNNYTIWQNKSVDVSSEPIKTEPSLGIGKIKLVDLSKLIDPDHKNKIEEQKKLESSVYTISDSDSDSTPPPSKSNKKLNNNNTSDDERHSSKSILKTRNNGQDKLNKSKDITKKVQFTNKDKIILFKLRCSDSSRSSDSEEEVPVVKHRSKSRSKRETDKNDLLPKIDAKLDAKFKWKSYVKLARADAYKMKTQYMLQLDNEKIKRLDRFKGF